MCDDAPLKLLKTMVKASDGNYCKTQYVRGKHGMQCKIRMSAPGHDVRVDARCESPDSLLADSLKARLSTHSLHCDTFEPPQAV